jgi:hypothetical protein
MTQSSDLTDPEFLEIPSSPLQLPSTPHRYAESSGVSSPLRSGSSPSARADRTLRAPAGYQLKGCWGKHKRTSHIYSHGVRLISTRSHQEYWGCRLCLKEGLENPGVYRTTSTTHSREHLLRVHQIDAQGNLTPTRARVLQLREQEDGQWRSYRPISRQDFLQSLLSLKLHAQLNDSQLTSTVLQTMVRLLYPLASEYFPRSRSTLRKWMDALLEIAVNNRVKSTLTQSFSRI